METRPELELTDREVSDIRLLCEVARAHDSHLSLNELFSLLQTSLSREELENAWRLNPTLNQSYVLKSGLIVPRKAPAKDSAADPETHEDQRGRSAKYILEQAERFSRLIKGPEVRLLSVSGSASYKSASTEDDVDFFCITSRGTAWIYITKVLLLARVYRQLQSNTPDLCLSCTMDEGYAERRFAAERDALFARDSLNVQVLRGRDYYRELLSRSNWISSFFPKLYERATAVTGRTDNVRRGDPSFIVRAFSLALYCTVGRYLRLKAFLLNRKFAKEGWSNSFFKTMLGKDHCIYESVRYATLRKKYQRIQPVTA